MKVCSGIVNYLPKRSVVFHGALYRFIEMRGAGTAALEAKLAQQLSRIANEPLFQVLLDVQKAYDSLDRERCLKLLRGYGLGLNLSRLLKSYWKRQRIVPKVGKCLGTEFGKGRGVTQGNPAYSMILNIVVDAVVLTVLEVVYISQEAQHGMGWAEGEINLVLYADDRRIAGWEYERAQY